MCRIAGNVVHVDTSQSGFTIYLTEEHELYGMGSDASGVLLSNTMPPSGDLQEWEDTIVTSPMLLMEDVVYARCGRDDVAVLKEDGSLWIWGVAWAVSGAKYCRSAPVRLMEDVIFVTGGFYHHAALKEDGSLWTWGYNYTGNCGTDENIYIETPIRVADEVEMVWTGQISYSTPCEKITDFRGTQPGQYENTIIKKNDGSFWACGKDLGNQTGKLEEYYEAADYETTYMAEFVPVELVTR